MKKLRHYIFVSLGLIVLSLTMFYAHYLVFGELKNTMYYSLMNICSIPINILAVTLVFEKLMEKRQRLERLGRLNMIIGFFFSDVGYKLLGLMVDSDEEAKIFKLDFSDLKVVESKLKIHPHDINFHKINYFKLEETLLASRDVLAQLIGNESILEHESFADLLISLMHLRDEFIFFKDKKLSDTDYNHLKVDTTRVYKALSYQWVRYLSHLEDSYPYQYSGAIKVSPFAKVEV
ncbi:MAG: hypothetical protein RR636_10635 [Clostridium sp.]|uniref:hypothetical protein n=1 Tax=Clostridium sp. TaxID=1506 RepID=UPI00304E9AAD